MDTYKREVKTLRAELDQQRAADNPYYVSVGGGDKLDDDDDALQRQQQRPGHDWTTVDEQAKVSLMFSQNLQLLYWIAELLYLLWLCVRALSCFCLYVSLFVCSLKENLHRLELCLFGFSDIFRRHLKTYYFQSLESLIIQSFFLVPEVHL